MILLGSVNKQFLSSQFTLNLYFCYFIFGLDSAGTYQVCPTVGHVTDVIDFC